MKVSVNKLIVFMFAAIMLLPDYFSSSLLNALENILLIGTGCILLKYRYRPSKWMYMAFVYCAVLVCSSYFNFTDRANFHLIISNLKIMVFLCAIEWETKKYGKNALKNIWRFLLIILSANTASIVLFPNGLYQIDYVWNEWGAKDVMRQWILGNKNSQTIWYLLLMILTYILFSDAHISRNKLKNRIVLLYTIAISAITMLLVASSTGIVAITVLAVGMILSFFRKSPIDFEWNPKWILVGYIIISILIIGGNATFLKPIIADLFGKDLTFSNRTTVWLRALLLFIQKPIFGWGVLGDDGMRNALGSLSYTSAHNQFLNTMLQGGTILFLILIAMVFIIFDKLSKCEDKKDKLVGSVGMIGVLVTMHFETVLGGTQCWMLLYCVYCLADVSATKVETRNSN